MEILDVELFPEEELIKRLRQVTMLEDRETKPYETAFISLERISVEDIFPTQLYVWKKELQKVRELEWQLQDKGVDMFSLNGFARLHLTNQDEPIDLLPPIVEECIEKNHRITHVINDGMHRIYLAYLEWVIPQVVFVRGVPKHLPYYAFPVPAKDWSKIQLVDDIPEGMIKKWHRIKRNKLLYRDYNSSFMNVGGPRGYSTGR